MTGYFPERTSKYKTYVKTALVEAFRDVFANHEDPMLQKTRTTIDFPKTETDYPTLIIRFFERNIFNAGIGHEEWINLKDPDGDSEGVYRFKHYMYKGDIEFAIYALSSYDRDLLADTITQTIAMGDMEGYTNRFLARIYTDNGIKYPDAVSHFININTDDIMGFGETQQPVPWKSEDEMIYATSYRANVFGEFYSPPPDLPAGIVSQVLAYPYIAGAEPVPQGNPNDGGTWLPILDTSLFDDQGWMS